MNKNRVAVIIAILFTIIVLAGGWFYLQYIMDNYGDDSEENSNAAVYPIDDTTINLKLCLIEADSSHA